MEDLLYCFHVHEALDEGEKDRGEKVWEGVSEGGREGGRGVEGMERWRIRSYFRKAKKLTHLP